MKLVQSLLMAGMGLSILGSQVSAADYFVQPLRSGPVANTPLSPISLQAILPDDESIPSGEQNADTAPTEAAPVKNAGSGEKTVKETAAAPTKKVVATAQAKWVSARTTSATTTTSTQQTTVATATTVAPATTTTAAAAPASAPVTTTAAAPVTTNLSGPTPVLNAAQTYKSFDTLMKSGKVVGGDRIFLLDGYHGPMVVDGRKFASPVLVTAMPGQVAHVDSINVRASQKVTFSGLKVWPSNSANGLISTVRSYGDTSDLIFTNLDVRAVANGTSYNQWTKTDWNSNQRSGFMIDGQRNTVLRNRVTGVYNGIFGLGPNALIEENIIDGFAGDALRALGDNSTVRRNKVQNCHQINASHTDGFQSFSRGTGGKVGTGVVRNVLIEDNKIFESVGTRSPINCKLQGISMFDGMYDGFVIRNNVVSTTAYHGITMGGALNSKIVNNTVIHASGLAGSFPWIRISPHKNGTPSNNVTVANNLVTSNKVKTDPVKAILETNNIVVTNAATEFNSVTKQDFTLRSTAKAIDMGKPTLAPADDIVMAPRPKGKGPDAGAYENF